MNMYLNAIEYIDYMSCLNLTGNLSVVDVLLDTLKSTDPFSASEALVFCIGSLKLLTGNATIVKQLVKKDCIENLAILLNSINKTVSQPFFLHTLASAVNSYTGTCMIFKVNVNQIFQIREGSEPSTQLGNILVQVSLTKLNVNACSCIHDKSITS